jgi:hypothetical protein
MNHTQRDSSGRAIWRTSILWLNGLFSLLVFLSPTLDGGFLSGAYAIGVYAYWAGAGLVLRRRRTLLRGTDYIYLGVGQVASVAACHYAFRVISRYA